jgi:hypothetical protein
MRRRRRTLVANDETDGRLDRLEVIDDGAELFVPSEKAKAKADQLGVSEERSHERTFS